MRPRRSLLAAALLVAPLATVATVSAAGPALANCSGGSGRSIVGTLKSADGMALNAMIGIDLTTANGTKVNAVTGCQSPKYAAQFRINKTLGAKGAKKGVTTFTVKNIPANAKRFFVEVYLEDAKNNYVTSPYGWTVRQQIPLKAGKNTIAMVAPLKKATGSFSMNVPGGGAHVLAFSQQASDLSVKSPGWYFSKPESNGTTFKFPSLAAGQTYVFVLPGGRLVCSGKIKAGKNNTGTHAC